MKCPYCGCVDTQVKDSRPADEGGAIRRRRACPQCDSRFTTFERIQRRDMRVEKKDGRMKPFDAEKLRRSISVALRKRPVEDDVIDRAVAEITRRLESRSSGANAAAAVSAEDIGAEAMRVLLTLDKVAYIRYASVYNDFSDTDDFKAILGELEQTPAAIRKDARSNLAKDARLSAVPAA